MTSERFIRVATVDEVPPGTGKLVMGLHAKPIALFNVEGAFYAINFICPHMGGPLASGRLTGTVVACPWHGWTFDVRTGQACALPCTEPLRVFPVTVEGDEVFIDVA